MPLTNGFAPTSYEQDQAALRATTAARNEP
jgi:hypothetical protein